MGRQIIKQPDGKFCVWSTIVDDFIIIDATPEEIIEIYIEEKSEEIKRSVYEVVDLLDQNKKPFYYSYDMTYEEACELRNRIHGDVEND